MKPTFQRVLPVGAAMFLVLTSTGWGADVVKANNTTALNDPASWSGGSVPSTSDVALWNSTVTTANTVALGGNLSWAGVKVTNPTGAVVVTHAANQTLTLGTSGIDVSGSQNLTLLNTANTTGTISVGANQTWNVASGRALTLFSTSNSANQRLSGSGNIAVAGGGVVNLNVGDAGNSSFTANNGNDTYTGNWTISGGSKVISLRNGTHAWGQGTITLDNGIMSQSNGNWSFSNNITVAAGGGTIYSDSTGTARYMNLTGGISGAGALTFNAVAAMTGQEGFILTGTNTFTGPMTIAANGTVRIGGDATTSTNSTAAGTLGSIPSTVAITNNGILGFGWSDSRTFANTISGNGIVRLGRSGGVLPANQVVTLSAANTYTGATQVNAGRLNLTGSLTSAITVASGGKLSGTGNTTGLLTLSTGGGLALAGGLTTTSFTVNGATFGGSNLVSFLSDPVPGTVYDVFTYGSGTVTTPNNLSVAWRGSLSNDAGGQKYVFTAGSAATRTWTAASGTWSQGAASTWSEGDQTFYGGDSVVFGEPASAATVTLSGRLVPASVLVNNSTNSYTFSGTDGTSDLTGAVALTKSGAGRLILNSAHTYTGTTSISGGVLEVGVGGTTGSLGSGAVSVASGAELVLNRSNAFTVSNTLSGDGLITKKGGGRLTVNGNNSGGALNWNFTGTGNGDIGFSNANALGGAGSSITLAQDATGGAFFSGSGNSTGVGISLGSGAVFTWNGSIGNTTTFTGVISGAGAFTKVSGETLRLSGVSTYAGATTVSTGTLEVFGAGQLGSGNYAGNIANAGTFSVNTSADQTLSGVISGAGSLSKSNSGKLTLSGTNTYTGATTATAGSLIINGATSSTSLVTIGSAATLGGSGVVGGDTTLAGVLAPGNSPGLLTFSGDLALGPGATILWELAASGTSGRGTLWDAVDVGGDLSFTGATTLQPVFGAVGSSVDFNDALWAAPLGLSGGWKVFDVAGAITGLEDLAVASGDFVDSQGNSLSAVRPGLSMLLYQNNGGIYLTTVSAIPEPGALFGLAGLLAGSCLLRRRAV